MGNISLQIFRDPNPQNRGYDFYNSSLTILRRDLICIVDRNEATYLRLVLDSKQSMAKVVASFDDKDFKRDVNIVPLGVMNVFTNSMMEDLKKIPPKATVRADDPTAMVQKKKELDKLVNRKILEKDRTELQKRIFGEDSKYKLPYDNFESNVEEFDQLGFDESDPDDVNFFGTNLHLLDYETAAQSLVNAAMKLCKFDQTHIQKYTRDAMAVECVCGQTFVDRVTGEIKNDYIYPEDYYYIPGDREDGHNDVAKGWYRTVTLDEFLSRAGNSFDWQRDWPKLIWALNYCNNTKYTGFMRSGITYNCVGDPNLMGRAGVDSTWTDSICEWSYAFRYKVFMGYTEWLCPEATASYLTRKDKSTTEKIPIDYNYELKERNNRKKKKKEDEEYYSNEYEKESWYQWQLYGSFYLATTMTSQYCFNYGKVYHTLLEGANDEYARYTCWSFRNQGRSMASISAPLVEAANFAWYRLIWILYKAKPEEDQFLINEILEVAKGLQQQFNQQGTNGVQMPMQSILDQVIQYQRQKTIRIRAYPRIDGREIGQLPPLKNENRGIDPMSGFMQSFVVMVQQMIANQIGFNPMRIGANPPSRESFKTEQSTLEASYNSTGYVGRMIGYIKVHMATTTLLFAQDIAKFKETLPYKWIERIVGEKQTKALQIIEQFAAHRYATFVEDTNDAVSIEDVKAAATMALQQKLITFEQWFVVTQTKNVLRSAQLLAYLQRKAEKRLRRQAVNDMKIQDDMAQRAHDREMQRLAFERETKTQVATIDSNAFISSAQVNKEGRVSVEELKQVNKIPHEEAKTQGKIAEETAKKNLDEQTPL